MSFLLAVSALLQAKDHSLPIPPLRYFAYFIAGVYLFTIVSAVVLRHTRCYRRLTYAQVITDVFLTSCLVFFSGSSQSMLTIVYFFPIIAAGFLLFRPGGLLVAALSTISYGALLFLEYAPSVAPGFVHLKGSGASIQTLLHHFSINGTSFFLVAFLSATLAERLHKIEATLTLTASNYDRLALLYKQIFDDIGTGIITVDCNGLITSFNRASEKITGFKAGEVLGTPLSRCFAGLEPVAQTLSRPLVDLTRRDGEKIPVGYSWARLNSPDGSENCRVFTMQDLSQIKKMEAQVRQSEKMAAIGEMSAGIAHEFRNPLAAISGSAQLLRQQFTDQPTSRKLMEIIIRECGRLEAVIHDFLRFSRPIAPEKSWFPLADIAREALLVLQQTPDWSNRFHVVLDIPPKLECWADPDQLKQVLLNLFGNSCQAMKNSGAQITVSAREGKRDNREILLLRVSDNGPGIAEKTMPKVFDPYFTTRENGTGLGLAIVHQIVKSHEGTLEAENRAQGGASFLIALPLP